jgi:hypothetical protein
MAIQRGDRFRVTRAVDAMPVFVIQKAPSLTSSAHGVLPSGTVIVALDQGPDATAFLAYPQDYDALEESLVPADVRSSDRYSAYGLSFWIDDVGDLLEPMPPLDPRPENHLPR